jgi:hypothetical protein
MRASLAGIRLAESCSMQGHHEALIIPVQANDFARVAAGRHEIDVSLPDGAQPGDTIILEEVEANGPTGRRVEATLTGIEAGAAHQHRHVRFQPKPSKYTPTSGVD